jgi:hypothetical protein
MWSVAIEPKTVRAVVWADAITDEVAAAEITRIVDAGPTTALGNVVEVTE